MIAKQKILIVDDDENIAELISLYLMKECFDTKIVSNGEDALSAFETYQPNLVLLDLMLPGIDGYQVCRELRAKSQVPIIMLSAKGEVFDKVLGLELGADDYIMKPFDSKEMVARVRAVLRRYQPVKPEAPAAEKVKCVEYDGLTINLTNYSVLCDGQNVDMPPKELELLSRDLCQRILYHLADFRKGCDCHGRTIRISPLISHQKQPVCLFSQKCIINPLIEQPFLI